ncbi:hypothetical protein L1887_02159 [Cichorium endivia]|nr:hypothetical protein L1887_02159 [Cichorium endivia]
MVDPSILALMLVLFNSSEPYVKHVAEFKLQNSSELTLTMFAMSGKNMNRFVHDYDGKIKIGSSENMKDLWVHKSQSSLTRHLDYVVDSTWDSRAVKSCNLSCGTPSLNVNMAT